MNVNMIRFRVGAWRINVNNLNMKQIVRRTSVCERHCDYCINNNCGKFCRVTGYGIREYGIRNTEYEIRSGLLDKYGDLKNVALPVV